MIIERLNHMKERIETPYPPLIDLSTLDIEEAYSFINNNSNNEINYYWIGRREYKITWKLQNKIQGKGLGKSKKEAEQEAAKIAMENFSQSF